MRYRPEIDGLRALSVLAVVAFHARLNVASGGFVGVDVFFVISGFLICRVLRDDLAEGRFSLPRFYMRRARRILPALFAVLVATIPAAWLWLPPTAFKDYGQSLVAVVAFAANLLFWRETGYFDAAAEAKPLLHTWSLAVEEQFYLLFPILLFAAWRLGPSGPWRLVLALAAVSLLTAELTATSAPADAFYLPHTRAWELLAGALLALGPPARTRGLAADALAFAGLAAIFAAILLFDRATPFPSLWALAPVGGTMLVLRYAVEGTATARALALPPLVGLGLLSYSFYLWHQPLFAFARAQGDGDLPTGLLAALVVAALALAWLTWRFVETPFRRPSGGRAYRLFPYAAPAVAAAVAFVGAVAHVADGAAWRYDPAARHVYAEAAWTSGCLLQAGDTWPNDAPLGCGDDDRPRVALLGDSVAASFADALRATLEDEGFALRQITHGHCLPLRRAHIDNPRARPCPRFIERAIAEINAGGYTAVIVAGLWSAGLDAPAPPPAFTVDLRETLAALRPPLIIVYPHPQALSPPRDSALDMIDRTGSLRPLSLARADVQRAAAPSVAWLDAAKPASAVVVRPEAVFCTGAAGDCALIDPPDVLLSDAVHFAPAGARRIAAEVAAALRSVQPADDLR